MKLPNESPLTNQSLASQHGEKSVTNTPQPTPVSHTSLPKNVQALINTWAKVQSSQALSPQQNQQVLSQLSLLMGQPSPNTQQGSGISQRLNINHLSASLDKQAPFNSQTQLVLIKLLSIKGAINILSTQGFKPGEEVRITQNSQGQLALTPKPLTTEVNFQQQFLPRDLTVKSNKVIDNHQLNQLMSGLSATKPPTPLPASIISTMQAVSAEDVKQAIQGSGQQFEAKLLSLLQTLQQGRSSIASVEKPLANNPSLHQPITQKLQQVEQSIQKWVQQFQANTLADTNQVTAKSTTSPATSSNATPNQAWQTQITQTLLSALEKTANINTIKPTLELLAKQLGNDQKTWLSQNQLVLVQKLTQQFSSYGDQFIPNWSSQSLQSSPIKTFNELNHWLDQLIKPKISSTSDQANPLKTGTSVQSQLHQTLSLLMSSVAKDESSDQALLRQLFNLSQNLMKTTADQLVNRSWFQQSDIQSFQFSLPYLHQNQVEWCELEYEENTAKTQQNEQTKSWHLILRFAQDTNEAFAIESKMVLGGLNITLWSDSAQQLKNLHENMPILKQKLSNAGFKLEDIHTKHGLPNPLKQPLQQSLIDVHT